MGQTRRRQSSQRRVQINQNWGPKGAGDNGGARVRGQAEEGDAGRRGQRRRREAVQLQKQLCLLLLLRRTQVQLSTPPHSLPSRVIFHQVHHSLLPHTLL